MLFEDQPIGWVHLEQLMNPLFWLDAQQNFEGNVPVACGEGYIKLEMSRPVQFHFDSGLPLFWLWFSQSDSRYVSLTMVLSVLLWFCQTICATVSLSVLLSDHLCFCQSICASVSLTVLLSVWLCFCQSGCAAVSLTVVISLTVDLFSAGMSTSVLVSIQFSNLVLFEHFWNVVSS